MQEKKFSELGQTDRWLFEIAVITKASVRIQLSSSTLSACWRYTVIPIDANNPTEHITILKPGILSIDITEYL